jgi:hypothetical protein
LSSLSAAPLRLCPSPPGLPSSVVLLPLPSCLSCGR